MLQRERTALVVIDVQGKLARIVQQSDSVLQNIARMVKGARVLGLPIVVTEQYPEGIGPTVDEIRDVLPASSLPLSKMTFSCCGAPEFVSRLAACTQVLLTGIESHVCVYQTCRDLLARRFEVHVVADAVSSRSPQTYAVALERMRAEGATITTVEMALFELVGAAEGDCFKKILRIVK